MFTRDQHSANTEYCMESHLPIKTRLMLLDYATATTMVPPPDNETHLDDVLHYLSPIKKPCTRQGGMLQ